MTGPRCFSLTAFRNSLPPSNDLMAKPQQKAAVHPNRFAFYLRERGLSRREIVADGTFTDHFRAWMREVRQRLAVRALNQRLEALKLK